MKKLILDFLLNKFILIILLAFMLIMINHGCITTIINPDKPPYTHPIFENKNLNENDNK